MNPLSCGCRVIDDMFLPACVEHLMEQRAGKDYEPMFCAGTFLIKKAGVRHPSLIRALVMADVELRTQQREAAA